jgi:glycosyltransferase involved in cell wall biosynthesis
VCLLRGLRLDGERLWTARFALLWLCELLAARGADTVVCVSDGVRRRAIDLRIPRRGSTVVLGKGSSNGVDATRFDPSNARRTALRAHLGCSDNEIVVGFVGRLTHDKGVYDLLEALRLLRRPVRLLLVGPPEPDVDLDTLWGRYSDVRTRVVHVEYTRDTVGYYAAMDVFALPSLREGMCNALLEAQAMELPCVTTDVTGCRDAVVPGVTAVVVAPHAPDQLAEAIDHLASRPDLRARMGRAGHQGVLQHFDPEKLWRRYARLYRAVTDAPSVEPAPPRNHRAVETA